MRPIQKERSIRKMLLLFGVTIFLAVVLVAFWNDIFRLKTITPFRGNNAFQFVEKQLSFGPRVPGSASHIYVQNMIRENLSSNGWEVETQESQIQDHTAYNIIAKRGTGLPWIILGAHYDSRLTANADPDPSKRNIPVSGANDGASGVAVLLELSRTLPEDIPGQFWLVFFDLEDQGNQPNWNWILGSRAFVSKLSGIPDAVIIIDMIGDTDLKVYYERNSNPELSNEIWQVADRLGYSKHFIPIGKYSILDDHTPFVENGITAIDIIDFDYPYWHTTGDTLDKVSKESLQIVGDVLWTWLCTN